MPGPTDPILIFLIQNCQLNQKSIYFQAKKVRVDFEFPYGTPRRKFKINPGLFCLEINWPRIEICHKHWFNWGQEGCGIYREIKHSIWGLCTTLKTKHFRMQTSLPSAESHFKSIYFLSQKVRGWFWISYLKSSGVYSK